MTILVFGSINMDLVARTPRLPAPGETLTGHDFFTAPGGKGANQAVAAARLEATTKMIGRVGADEFGPTLLEALAGAGVDTSLVVTDTQVSSGTAHIAVDDEGQNTIIIVPGANGQVGTEELSRLQATLRAAQILLLQLEIPLDMTREAAQLAHDAGLTVVLDPAPARELPADLYPLIDILTPNEVEAGQLTGETVNNPATAKTATVTLRERGVQTAIIKLGQQGVVYAEGEAEPVHMPAYPVQATDTVAAGDAFNGGLAAALAARLSLPEAVRWGAAAGALSTTAAGAQPSMPRRQIFDTFLEQYA